MAKNESIVIEKAPATKYITQQKTREFWKAVCGLEVGQIARYPRRGKSGTSTKSNLAVATIALGVALDRVYRSRADEKSAYVVRLA